ncbi:tyrosine-type recombinase/integrase [Candidatus Micrarchaeota archaeon]|nr:tyrosine-type recombinase/integrase [Candidatus Micrarchaeota archaeon]
MPKHQYPEQVEWLAPKAFERRRLPEDILTPEEVKKLAQAAFNLRDRAIIMLTYESGCRAAEIIGLRIKDVKFDKYGATIRADGKTGMREIPIGTNIPAGLSSIPDLKNWLNHHPHSDNPDAPLFPERRTMEKHMGNHATLAHIFNNVTKRAGLKKHVHPHLLRHSRATHLAKYLTEQELKVIMGWTASSRMAGVYVHLGGQDVRKKILQINGKEDKETEEETLKTIICPRCEEENPPTAKFCIKCAAALTLNAANELRSAVAEKEKILEMFLDDPEVQKVMKRRAPNILASLNNDEEVKLVFKKRS